MSLAHAEERIAQEACGCRYDVPTGVTTAHCWRHDPARAWAVLYAVEEEMRHQWREIRYWRQQLQQLERPSQEASAAIMNLNLARLTFNQLAALRRVGRTV